MHNTFQWVRVRPWCIIQALSILPYVLKPAWNKDGLHIVYIVQSSGCIFADLFWQLLFSAHLWTAQLTLGRKRNVAFKLRSHFLPASMKRNACEELQQVTFVQASEDLSLHIAFQLVTGEGANTLRVLHLIQPGQWISYFSAWGDGSTWLMQLEASKNFWARMLAIST